MFFMLVFFTKLQFLNGASLDAPCRKLKSFFYFWLLALINIYLLFIDRDIMAPNGNISMSNRDIGNDDFDISKRRNVCNVNGTLSNKYAKLMHFGVWLISNVDMSNEIRNDFFNKLNVFENVETQANFFDNFYSCEKETAKTMRKFITEKLREQKKTQLVAKEIGPKGRDQILRDAFIDNIIAKFGVGGRTNNFILPIL